MNYNDKVMIAGRDGLKGGGYWSHTCLAEAVGRPRIKYDFLALYNIASDCMHKQLQDGSLHLESSQVLTKCWPY